MEVSKYARGDCAMYPYGVFESISGGVGFYTHGSAVSFFIGFPPPGVGVVTPVVRGGFALRRPYAICRCWWGPTATRKKLGEKRKMRVDTET